MSVSLPAQVRTLLLGAFVGACLAAPAQAGGDEVRILSITLAEVRVIGGVSVQGLVTLDRPAPHDDVWVELHADGDAHPPFALRVPAGEREARFTLLTDPVEVGHTTVVHGSTPGSKASASLDLVPGGDVLVAKERSDGR